MAALLALLAAVGWGSSDYAAGSASRRSSAVSVVVLTHLAAVVALALVALDYEPVRATLSDLWRAVRPHEPLTPVDTTRSIGWAPPRLGAEPTTTDVLWGLAAGLGGGLGAMLLFRGLGRGSMAVVAPITATGAAAIPAMFGIATGEAVTLPGVVGIGLALIAIVLVSLAGDGLPDGDPPAGSATAHLPPPATARRGLQPLPPPNPGADRFPPHRPVPAAVDGGPEPGDAFAAATVPPQLGVGLLPPVSAHPSPWPDRTTASAVHADGSSDPAGEIRMSLRRMRSTILALTFAALLAAAVSAAGPIGALAAGDRLSSADLASLALAAVVAVLALTAVNAVKLLFQVQAARPAHLERRTDPPSFDGRSRRVERRVDASSFDVRAIVRQPGVPEALLSGIGFGLFFVFISRAADTAGYWPLVGARAVSVVMFSVAALVTTTPLMPASGSRRWVVLAGVLDAAAAVFFVASTRAGLLSVGAVLASLYPVVTVLLARFVGGERIRRRQLVGLALAVGAVSLLAV